MKFKDVKNYEGLYKVSDSGEVITIKTGVLKKSSKNNGYLIVDLFKNNKRTKISIHRLVAIAFIPNPKMITYKVIYLE